MVESDDDSRYLAMKTVMMPSDMNPHGTIFAGAILSRMAMAGIQGAHHAVRRSGWPDRVLVARAMQGTEFYRPSLVGDVVSCWTRVLNVGTTSITVHIQAEAERAGETILLAETEATYVAVEGEEEPRRAVPIRGG